MKMPNTTIGFIDAIKTEYGLPSDGAVARAIGVTRQTLSKYRRGHDCLGDEPAINAAELLGLSKGYVLACVYAERASLPPVKQAWEEVANSVAKNAAV